ncbi:cytochrome-c peroxidase [Sphingobacteriaceae bacterium]|nr:cytochrome-c peroxidase [Sphingobacteriaceae bacterium]
MRIKITYFSFTLLLLCLFFVSFTNDNPFFNITAKDVELKIPKGFPKPKYTFAKNKLSPDVFILGRRLFYDNILSKDNSISCSSCHQRIAAFAHIDHRLSHGINGRIGTRNIPALQNLIWQDSYMWDGGVNNLEVQPLNPITNPLEMDETLSNVLLKLKRDSTYAQLFKKAYHDTIINSERLLKSLAQFTGLMVSSNSRYDKFLNHQDTFSKAELQGLKLFRSKCANCHTEPLFTDNSYRNNGIKTDTSLKDSGRFKITGVEKDKNCFKVPGLRNIAMTYPYMHDGRFRNLREVVNYYSSPKNFEKSADLSLLKIGTLNETEKKDLLAFLMTLTDKEFLYDRRFADPGVNY